MMKGKLAQCLTYGKDAGDNEGCREGGRAWEEGVEKEEAGRRKRESLAAESKFRTANKSIASLPNSQVQIQLGYLLAEIFKASQ